MQKDQTAMSNHFYRPIHSKIYLEGGGISKDSKVEAHEFLTQIMMINREVDFRFALKTFFLNIFELIISPIKVLLLLINLFLMKPRSEWTFSRSELMVAREKLGQKIREKVLLFLVIWLTSREKDFLYGREELFELLYMFFQKYIREKSWKPELTKDRVIGLTELIKHIRDVKKRIIAQKNQILNSSGTSFHEEKIIEENQISEIFKSADNETIANTLFIIDLQIFYRLSVYELNPRRINEFGHNSQGYDDYVHRLNCFTYLYVWLIISEKALSSRLAMMKKLLSLAIKMKHGNPINLEGYYSIKLAFQQAAIHHRKYEFDLLKHSFQVKLSALEISEYNLFYENRKEEFQENLKYLKQIEGPFVPSLRLFLQYIARNGDKVMTGKKEGLVRNSMNMANLITFNEIFNFVEKMHSHQPSLQYLKTIEHLTKHPLYYFLEKGYEGFLKSNLGVKNLNSRETPEVLFRLSRSLP